MLTEAEEVQMHYKGWPKDPWESQEGPGLRILRVNIVCGCRLAVYNIPNNCV